MFKYVLLFSLVGGGIGWFLRDQRLAFLVILAIAILWGLSTRMIWGFVTLGELMLGFGAVRYFVLRTTNRAGDTN